MFHKNTFLVKIDALTHNLDTVLVTLIRGSTLVLWRYDLYPVLPGLTGLLDSLCSIRINFASKELFLQMQMIAVAQFDPVK